jgi:hypothetical protein
MKKEGTPKYKEPKTKTSDEKKGTPKCKGIKIKASDKKRQIQNARGSRQTPLAKRETQTYKTSKTKCTKAISQN